ncbi:MAG TPA: DUF2497 domain-containing protein [Alphaproteobacteria bacterium]
MAEQNDQEPSIEEILASIREIISDDDQPKEEAAAPAPEPEPAPAPEPDLPDDVLDLAAFAEAPGEMKIPEDEQADPLAGIDFDKPKEQTVDFTDPLAEVAPTPEPEPEVSSMPDFGATDTIPTPGPVDSIISEAAKSASLDSMTKLAQNIAISRGNGGTLEDIVRDMLKPMLRQWLDTNLPPMIERMVELELERIAKKAMDR